MSSTESHDPFIATLVRQVPPQVKAYPPDSQLASGTQFDMGSGEHA
jgi:hypothetical protein